MSKNRKTFIYVLQCGKTPGARIYRIIKNKPVFIGFAEFRCKDHISHIQSWLVKKGHIQPTHSKGIHFRLSGV